MVLTPAGGVTRPGGLLRIAVKEGDGDGWSTHGAISSPRHFTYWRAAPLGVLVAGAAWGDVVVDRAPGRTPGESWLTLRAVRS